MGKFFAGCGLVFLLLVGGCVAMLMWAAKEGAAAQEKFYKAVESGDPQQVLDLCDPALREQIDAPVLAAWQKAVRTKLGAYKEMSTSDFSTNANSENGVTTIESKGTVHFEHGDAKSELKFRNGLLTAFNIESEKLTGGWYQGVTETKLYRERGEQFVRKFLADDVEGAFAMMHESLQKNSPKDKLAPIMKEIADEAGSLKSATFESEKFTDDDGARTLAIAYKCETEKKQYKAEIRFQFADLRGHLIGFDFEPVQK